MTRRECEMDTQFLRFSAGFGDTVTPVVSDYDVRHMYERLYDYMGLDLDVKSNGGH